MSRFRCRVCDSEFEVSSAARARYPGWEPGYCREHSPSRAAARGGSGSPRSSRPKPSRASREELLSRAQVLEKYTAGPQSGVFTDGSSIPNPGPGGWGVVWVEDGEIREDRHGHVADTTNNRMELTALIEAYRLLPEDASVVVYTDSKLCADTLNQWAARWEQKGWTRKGPPIKNLDLIQPLWALFFTVGTLAGFVSHVCLSIADVLDDFGEPRLLALLAGIGLIWVFRSVLVGVLDFFRFFSV